MNKVVVGKAKKLTGCITVPGDKSISHRVALLSLLCKEPIEVTNFAEGEDCQRSLEVIESLGGKVEDSNNNLRLLPPGDGLKSPAQPIDCGNSGTTMRVLSGLLAGSKIYSTLVGDESLSLRPMLRIAEPLRKMNAAIEVSENGTAPITISPADLIPIDYILPVASAQVKSSLLMAGLAAKCPVVVREKIITRNHTEKLIKYLGGNILIEDVKLETVRDPNDPRKKKQRPATDKFKRSIIFSPENLLRGGEINIPGDISTAAFIIAAALMVRGSHVILKDVGINPTRTGFINVLKSMGADIKVKNRRDVSGEQIGDIEVKYSLLKPRKISGEIVPGVIDEIPILAVLAPTINGTTIIRDAAELRVKETDRIKAIAANLSAMGVKTGEFPDGLAIEGSGELNGCELDSFGDHRIAMAFAVAGLAAYGQTIINNSEAVNNSCPHFYEMLEGLRS